MALLIFFEISTKMHFLSLFVLNERNITTSLLMIHLTCTVVHNANLNSSSINKPYLRAVEYAILFFFRFRIHVFLKRFLSKILLKNYHFLVQISKTYFQM